MRIARLAWAPAAILCFALCLGSTSRAGAPNSDGAGGPSPNSAAQARPEIEKQRKAAEQQAHKTLDKEAIQAIDETRNAIKAISDNKVADALAAIERATGKIDILLARNPSKALIPVSLEVDVIESAPLDVQTIKTRAKAAEKAVANKDYPTARVLLAGLTSEIRVRTFNLPLATYPIALKEAAQLLDQKKPQEASRLLTMALNSLVIVDRVTPLPLALAQAAIDEARSLRDKNREEAMARLETAKRELERAKELGYAGRDPEYATLDKSISDLEKQLKGKDDTASAFSKLTERLSSFFKRESETERR